MSAWDLSTGRRRGAALGANFEAAFAPIRAERDWWPDTTKHSARTVLRSRELGAEQAVTDRVFRQWLHTSLREWKATRSGAIPPAGLARRLTAPAFVETLRRAGRISLTDFTASKHADVLGQLFQGLDGIKSSEAQVVAVSKTLYHLLPELIVPFDNVITSGFFGWSRLPDHAEEAWLLDMYGVLAGTARTVGRATLEALGTLPGARDPAVGAALRLGQGRVIDLGMEGYRRSRTQAWYVD